MSQPSHRAISHLHEHWAAMRARRKAEREHAARFSHESHSLGDDSQIEATPPKGDAA